MASRLGIATADERLLDCLQLYLGYRAAAQAGAPEEHMVLGWTQIARPHDPVFHATLAEFLQPFMEASGSATWKTLYQHTSQGALGPDRMIKYAEFAEQFLLWAHRNSPVWKDAWDTMKSRRKAVQIHAILQEDDPASQVRKLAELPSIAGLNRIRKWLEGAAGKLGKPLTAVESVSADAETVKTLSGRMAAVQTALDAAVPMSEDQADLQEQKASLAKQVKHVVDNSADSAAVLAAAVSSQTTSKVAQKARLNDEQVRAMLSEGRVLITAGAGAGKTAVMAAKVAYHVQEQGMSPDQVLAVSFTRKAATELRERVEQLYGIQSDTISTTHTLAGNLLREFMPGARAVLAKTSPRNSDKLMRLAYAQIALAPQANNWGYGGRGGWKGRRAAWAGSNQRTPYWKEPAGEWFNLGVPIVTREGKPIGKNTLAAIVEVAQSHNETWQDVKARADQAPNNEILRFGAAFYAAYEWLKRNDTELGPYRDFNDWLADAANLLEDNPQALAAVQRRFKVVLVDEAQDLNLQQQRLFDQIAAKAKVYAQIGDDRQCVSVDTLIDTPTGKVAAGDLRAGDQVLAYRNGQTAYQTVRHVMPSSWECGYQITTESGNSLLMSPNHKIWATPVESTSEQHLVYCMYREDLGYRVGVTNHGRTATNPYGLRPHSERASHMWILDVVNTREEALELELTYSLTYGVPTLVFEGEKRGLNQDRINRVFAKFGAHGEALLADKGFDFEMPHWMGASYSKFGHKSRTIRLTSHSKAGSQVALEWAGNDLDEALRGVRQSGGNTKVAGSKRIRRWFNNYREALAFAQDLHDRTGAKVCERLSISDELLPLLTSASLHVGQRIPVKGLDGAVALELITRIEKVPGKFVDLDVEDASCFFGNGILSHNSIYKFRGAVPEQFTGLPQKGFQTFGLTFNYRSGKNIVEAAEALIKYNGNRQIDKVCRANPSRPNEGVVEMVDPDTHEAGAVLAAEEIANSCQEGVGGSPSDFGILVRNNAEADAYALALMSRGIPFRSRMSYFDKPAVKALLAWCRLAVSKSPEEINAATLVAHQRPGFFLGDKFVEGLQQYCPRGQTYAEYLIGGGTAYQTGYNAKNMQAYGEVIQRLQGFQGSATDLINAVLGVTGSKGVSFRDALAEDVDPEDLMEGTEKMEVSKEEIQEAALAPISPLIKMAQKFEDPEKWLAFVARMVAANDKTLKKEEDQAAAVRIDTVHSWKGLQAKHVYVVMAGGGVFPSKFAQAEEESDPNALDEERRLAYVAITRGEDAVTVICPKQNYRNKPAEVPKFVAEACIKPRAGTQTASAVSKTAVTHGYDEIDPMEVPRDNLTMDQLWGAYK